MLVDKKKTRSAEVPTSSLADIAFLILIFFLISSTMDVDKGVTLTLPGLEQETKIKSKNISNILISAEGNVMFDEQLVEIPVIKELVREKLFENENQIFSLKPVSETEYEIYIRVLDQIKQGGAKKISLAEPDF
ncbi:biopolymer transporter ExbD [candidate division KSB1 bacterium]|nr:biopolymer transporter ExbD [candidate division KSB1 bacterium]